MTDREWIVASTDTGPGEVTVSFYERHELGRPGAVVSKTLDLFEMERLHTVIGKALWWHLRKSN